MTTVKQWLAETHGPDFELLRHFIGRFFEGDLVSTAAQWAPVMIGNLSMGLPAFLMIVPPLVGKYRRLAKIADPQLYGHAVRADEVWLITLGMSLVGLLTSFRLPSLFPSLRDYLALGALPVRPRQIFMAKLAALLLLASAAILIVNLVPGLTFPMISGGKWQTNPSLLAHVAAHLAAHLAACILACYFCYLSLVAAQGVLLNLLRPALFARFTVYLQGGLISLMLVTLVLSFSIGPGFEAALLRSEIGRWLPPVWFLGLYQKMLGDPDPLFAMLAGRARAGFMSVMVLALLSYLLSYKRHRELLMERPTGRRKSGEWGQALLDRLAPDPREQGVLIFMGQTLTRSGLHRVLLMGYLGLAVALTLSGTIGIGSLFKDDLALLASFVYGHLLSLMILLLGIRHMFAMPAELRANWVFQVTERAGRREWSRAVDLFVLAPALIAILAIPLPVEYFLLGWRAAGETIWVSCALLLYHEFLFMHWEKMPFTCSYAPGKTPPLILLAGFAGVMALLPLLTAIVVAALHNTAAYLVELAAILAIWFWLRRSRNLTRGEGPLQYEDAIEPAVRELGLGKS